MSVRLLGPFLVLLFCSATGVVSAFPDVVYLRGDTLETSTKPLAPFPTMAATALR